MGKRKMFSPADNLVALAMLYQVNPSELLVEETPVPSSCQFGKNIAA